MIQTAENLMQDQLKLVRVKFIELLDERIDELEALRQQVDQLELRTEALQKTQFIAHKLHGTAATLGFSEIGRLAAKAENTIIQYLAGNSTGPTIEATKQTIDNFLESAAEVSSEMFWKPA